MDNEIIDDEDDPEAWAIRRYREVYAEFEARHPTQLRANKFVDDLFQKSRIRGDSTRLDREAARMGDELHVSYHQLSDVFGAAPPEIREHLFRLLYRLMSAVHELGAHDAPEGRSARDVRSDRAGAKGRALEIAVRVYLEAHPELGAPRVGKKFADRIRKDILELLRLPKDAKSPSIGSIVRALSSVKESRSAL